MYTSVCLLKLFYFRAIFEGPHNETLTTRIVPFVACCSSFYWHSQGELRKNET